MPTGWSQQQNKHAVEQVRCIACLTLCAPSPPQAHTRGKCPLKTSTTLPVWTPAFTADAILITECPCTCKQARQKVSSTCGSINQVYSFVEQATDSTAAQLESTKLALQQHAARQPAPAAEAHLEPGPGQVQGPYCLQEHTHTHTLSSESATFPKLLLCASMAGIAEATGRAKCGQGAQLVCEAGACKLIDLGFPRHEHGGTSMAAVQLCPRCLQ